jgi:PAS domain S-box-containing protein
MQTLESNAKFLEQMARNSHDVYWISSADFERIAHISPAYEQIWGRPRQSLYKNPEIWVNHLAPEDKQGYKPIAAMAQRVKLQGAAARYQETYRIVRPNGQVRWILDKGFPVCDEEGQCFAVSGVAIDITEQLARCRKPMTSTQCQQLSKLTKREKEVLKQIALGRSLEMVASVLSISRRTVESHMENIKLKLEVHSKFALFEKALGIFYGILPC